MLNDETGHSIGNQVILRYLSSRVSKDKKVGGILLISPWLTVDRHTKSRRQSSLENRVVNSWFHLLPWMERNIDFPVSFLEVSLKNTNKVGILA